MSEPARAEPQRAPLEVRVGSATNALQPVPGASRSLAAGPSQWVGLALVAVAAACADQLTKAIVSNRLSLGGAVDVAGPFTIHHVRNTGIAFGLFADSTSVVIVDRLRLGYVTDFLDLDYWPAFNLADTFIVVGVGLLFLSFVAADRASAAVGISPLSRS